MFLCRSLLEGWGTSNADRFVGHLVRLAGGFVNTVQPTRRDGDASRSCPPYVETRPSPFGGNESTQHRGSHVVESNHRLIAAGAVVRVSGIDVEISDVLTEQHRSAVPDCGRIVGLEADADVPKGDVFDMATVESVRWQRPPLVRLGMTLFGN